MAWLTRAPIGSPVPCAPLENGVTGTLYPVGVKLNSPSRIRVITARNHPTDKNNGAWRDSTDGGATWGAEQQRDWYPALPYPDAGGITDIYRGRSGRIHAALMWHHWLGDFSKYPNYDGWAVKYYPQYTYSDDEGATWAPYEDVPYIGWGGYGIDVIELSNGEVVVSWDGGAPDHGPPYTLNNTGSYPSAYNSVRDPATGTWSMITTPMAAASGGAQGLDYFNHVPGAYIWSEQQLDVIHDGSTHGIVICTITKNIIDVAYSDRFITRSFDGCRTWTTPQYQNQGVNRGGLCVGPDGDVIHTYCNGFQPVMRVSQDQGVTWGSPVVLGSGGYNWVSPFPIAPSGVSPNVGIAWGTSTADDAHGQSYYINVSRGSDVVAPSDPLTLASGNPIWSQSGTTLTVNHAPSGSRSTVAATIVTPRSGLVRFVGTDASRFSVSADNSTWGSSLQVAGGTRTIYLGVTPQAGDSTLSAQVGIPI